MDEEIIEEKRKRYWLRGGIIGFVIGVMSLVSFLMGSFGIAYYIGIVSVFIGGLILGVLPDLVGKFMSVFSFGIFTAPVIYFIIGIIIGGVYGRIKSKKDNY